MLLATHVAQSLRDLGEPQLGCGVSLGEADLRGSVRPDVSILVSSKVRWPIVSRWRLERLCACRYFPASHRLVRRC